MAIDDKAPAAADMHSNLAVIFHAGILTGLIQRFSAEAWEKAAESAFLNHEYRSLMRELARLRRTCLASVPSPPEQLSQDACAEALLRSRDRARAKNHRDSRRRSAARVFLRITDGTFR